MQFPESWLRQFIDPALTTDELAHTLTMAGLEVEETRPVAPPFSGVVVARIRAVSQHPDADRLVVCDVDDGDSPSVQVVCGAPNARAGLTVALARPGAQLPDGTTIRKAKMRGVESSGMLCSARELGLSQDHEGLMELDRGLQPGTPLRDALDLDDTCFVVKLTPNRADCLSIAGVAREVAALTGAPVHGPSFQPVIPELDERLAVHVEADDLCGRFAGRVIRGVNARAQTPDWMVQRLVRSGQRPVSALVDISNYVMLELGRPTHVFDLAKIGGPLHVRWGRAGETLELLNGQVVDLDETVGVIATADKPESLAGIMGGEDTSVTLDTTDIYLEGAFWWPAAIMGRARAYKLESEASHRFERGVDAASIAPHLERVSRLILDICGGKAGPLDDQTVTLPSRDPVSMRLARCNKVLGITLDEALVSDIFQRLQFDFEWQDDIVIVMPPSWRFDIEIEEDLIEEVARIHGFEQIPDRPPVALANIQVQPESSRDGHALRAAMAARGYQEVINFSFVHEDWERDYAANDDPIRLLNPIASHLSVMRSSLMGGLLATVRHNAHHRQPRVRIFELGRVFRREPQIQAGDLAVAGIDQPMRLAAAAWGPAHPEQWGLPERPVDFYDVKRDLEALLGKGAGDLVCVAQPHPALHPGRSARLELAGKPVGWLGELHPRWMQDMGLSRAPVLFEIDAQALSTVPLPDVRPLSRQPVVIRDLAVWVGVDVSFQDVVDTLRSAIAAQSHLAIVKDFGLFDVWRDKTAQSGDKSLALRFWLQGHGTTLDEATIEHGMQSLLQALADVHGARLRD